MALIGYLEKNYLGRISAIHFLKDKVYILNLQTIYAHVATNGVNFRLDQQI